MTRRRVVAIAAVASLLVPLGAGGAGADDERAARVREGRRLFVEHGCYGCHLVGGFGTPIATELTHIGAKYPEVYLDQWLADPRAQKPRAHMPRLPIPAEDTRALAAYLATLR